MSKHLHCFIGHRFTQSYLEDFRDAIEAAFDKYKEVLVSDYADNTLVDGHILRDKIKPSIDGSFLCIFDISEQDKPNVFIELGMAMGMGKRVVLTSKVAPPTDLAGYDTIIYGSFRELTRKLEKFLPQIIGDVLPTVAKPVAEIPGTVTRLIWNNHRQGKPTRKSDILALCPGIKGALSVATESGLLKDCGDSIAIPDNMMAFFTGMFGKEQS
jgi:hypothetical protein